MGWGLIRACHSTMLSIHCYKWRPLFLEICSFESKQKQNKLTRLKNVMCTGEDCRLHSWKDSSGFHGVWYLGIGLPHSSCSKMLRTQLGIQFQTECRAYRSAMKDFKRTRERVQILRAPQKSLGDAVGWGLSITLFKRTFRICQEFMGFDTTKLGSHSSSTKVLMRIQPGIQFQIESKDLSLFNGEFHIGIQKFDKS